MIRTVSVYLTTILIVLFLVNSNDLLAAQKKIKIVTPPEAPPIASGYKSRMGINGQMRNQTHQGIDITGKDGQPIISVAPGIVLESTIEKCWGPTIAIDHGNDFNGEKIIALYGHLGEMLVSAGDKVQRGQLIGRLGNNQYDFKCIFKIRHLHFQIGREYTTNKNGWGSGYFLKDWNNGRNPHYYWSDGEGLITCYRDGVKYREGSITYPVPCE